MQKLDILVRGSACEVVIRGVGSTFDVKLNLKASEFVVRP